MLSECVLNISLLSLYPLIGGITSMVKKVFGKVPAILAALILALAFASCDTGTGAGGGIGGGEGEDHVHASGTITITGLQRFAGNEIYVAGFSTDDSSYFFQSDPVTIPGNGSVTIGLTRSYEAGGLMPAAWVNSRNVIFAIFIYDDDENDIAEGVIYPVNFSGGSATITDANIDWD